MVLCIGKKNFHHSLLLKFPSSSSHDPLAHPTHTHTHTHTHMREVLCTCTPCMSIIITNVVHCPHLHLLCFSGPLKLPLDDHLSQVHCQPALLHCSLKSGQTPTRTTCTGKNGGKLFIHIIKQHNCTTMETQLSGSGSGSAKTRFVTGEKQSG